MLVGLAGRHGITRLHAGTVTLAVWGNFGARGALANLERRCIVELQAAKGFIENKSKRQLKIINNVLAGCKPGQGQGFRSRGAENPCFLAGQLQRTRDRCHQESSLQKFVEPMSLALQYLGAE